MPSRGVRGLRETLFIGRELLRRARFHVLRTPGLAAASLLIGVALWVVVTEEENPTRIEVFPSAIALEAVNVDARLAVASGLPSVQVRVAAPEDRWDRLTAANFRAFVDLSEREAREQRVPVEVAITGVSRVRVLETIPSTVVVNLEDLVTKQVSITPRVVGVLPRGYELGETTPDRRFAEVAGPKSRVDLVEEVAASVNVTGLTVGLEQSVALTPVGEGGGEIGGVSVRPATVRVAVAVAQTALTRTLPLEVELTGQPAPGYRVAGVRVTPSTVRAEGTIDVLQAIDALRLPRVDISGQQADVRTNVRLAPPTGVTVPAASTVAVEVTIVPVVGSQLITVAPEVINVRSGFLARVTPGAIAITLEGPLPRLNALQAGAVRATVDATPLGLGVSEARVQVSVPDGIAVREVQPSTVSVTLARP